MSSNFCIGNMFYITCLTHTYVLGSHGDTLQLHMQFIQRVFLLQATRESVSGTASSTHCVCLNGQ